MCLCTVVRLNPALALVFFYSVWYALGWWLWGHQAQLARFFKGSGWCLALSLGLYLLYLVGYYEQVAQPRFLMRYLISFLYQLSMSLAVFALFGIAWSRGASCVMRYLSGASYWLYLVQIPLISGLIVLTTKPGASCYQQCFIVSVATLLLGLVSYHWCVRSTWLTRFVGKETKNHA